MEKLNTMPREKLIEGLKMADRYIKSLEEQNKRQNGENISLQYKLNHYTHIALSVVDALETILDISTTYEELENYINNIITDINIRTKLIDENFNFESEEE